MKYVKKPIPVEAFQFGVDPTPEWANFLQFSTEIKTLEGSLFVQPGDYVVKGIYGEVYPVRADIFELTYERYEEKGKCNE